MKKGKLISKIFGIALALVMVGSILGGDLGSTSVALADEASSVSLHVPYFSQCDGRWASRACCDMDPNKDYDDRPDVYRPGTLYWFGCAISSFAMVLNYYGVNAADSTLTYSSYFPRDTNPRDLSEWLGDHGGCTEGDLHWRIDMDGGYSNSASRAIRQIEHLRFENGIDATQVYTIKVALEHGNPVIASVRTDAGEVHFVVITGIKGNTYYINDPGFPKKTTLASYDNKIYSIRIFDGTPHASVMSSGLYAGSSDPGLVYYYVGSNVWIPVSSEEELGHAYAVLCLVEFGGHLYAGTTSVFGGHSDVGRVYRYDGGNTWTLVSDNMDGAVCSLAVYQGDLYAGTSWNGMKLYRYEGNPNWRPVIDSPIWSGTRSLYVSHDYLLMGDAGMDYFGHWDGSSFYADLADGGSCIYDYQDYGDNVYAAAFLGRMWRSSDGINWSLAPGFESYYDGNMWELEKFKGSLYMSYNNGELWASDGSERGTCKFIAPDGIISMTTGGYSSTGDPPYLYFGTGGDAVGFGPESTGIANVYCYNGFIVEQISLSDEFGAGVQVLYTVRPSPISWYLCSPADMIVTDPDGLTISKELNEIPGATYSEVDLDGDGDPDDVVDIPDRKVGDYLITVIPEPDASPTDTYTLGVSAGGVTIVLAENVQISDIPAEGYIVRSTETEIMQIIPAAIDFAPDVLNLEAKGKYITAYIELPPGYDVSQIDIFSIRLNGTVPALGKPTEIGDYDDDGVPDLMVKFHRTMVQDALTLGEEVGVTITGEVNGIIFVGSDAIRVITAAAHHGRGEWTRISAPTIEGWVLAPDSVIVDYAVADDGDVAYVIVYSDDTSQFHLLKSNDSAATWEDIINSVEDALDDNDYINYSTRVATDNTAPDFLTITLDMWDDSDGANEVHVFISDDGGATFEDAGEVEDGGVYFPDGYRLSDLEVSPEVDGKRDIAIGGRDNYGDAVLFRCTVTGDSAGDWENTTTYVGWDDNGTFTSMLVTDIIFSPSWTVDKTILVTTVTETGMDIYTVDLQCGSWGMSEGWNADSILGIDAVPVIEDVDIPMWLGDLDARWIAGITVPSDYNSKSTDTRYAWVWVNYYDLDWGEPACEIMRVDDDSVDPVGPMGQIEDSELWLTNVSYQGTIAEGEAIAGVLGTGTYDPVHGSPEDLLTECGEGVQVYRNDGIRNMDICCERWHDACKPPTGTFAMAVSYVGEDKAYAVSLWGFFSPYDEDAWSVSFDDGDFWNQLSLVDTHIDYLSDVAVSPDGNKTMLVSVNDDNGCGCDSVWLHAENLPEAPEYSGKWLRTWCGQLEGDIGEGWERGLLRLAPEETTGDNVYLADYGTGNVYWNNMETLSCWDPIGCTELDFIVDLAAQDADTLYALDYYGDVATFDEDEWQEGVDSKVEYGWTIAVQGDDILVGGCDGDVSYSDDGGETFTELEQVPVVAADYTLVTVAFDSYFDANNTIYAAVAGFEGSSPTTGGIYRWVIGESDEWENLGAEDYAYTGLALNIPSGGKPKTSADTGGVLYASYVSGDTTGVARCLTPAEDVCCSGTDWDYLTRGLTSELFKMTPQALKICNCLTADLGSRLFAIDSSDCYDMEEGRTGTVWSFED